jgi:hypothetical protein
MVTAGRHFTPMHSYCQVAGSWQRMPDGVNAPKSTCPYTVVPKIVLFGVQNRSAVTCGLASFDVILILMA